MNCFFLFKVPKSAAAQRTLGMSPLLPRRCCWRYGWPLAPHSERAFQIVRATRRFDMPKVAAATRRFIDLSHGTIEADRILVFQAAHHWRLS